MRSLKQKQHWVHLAAAVVASLAAGSEPCLAHAQEPLDVFLAAGRVRALDAREAALVHEQARAQIDEARARWLPSLSVTGGYTRNEVDVVVTIPDGPSS